MCHSVQLQCIINVLGILVKGPTPPSSRPNFLLYSFTYAASFLPMICNYTILVIAYQYCDSCYHNTLHAWGCARVHLLNTNTAILVDAHALVLSLVRPRQPSASTELRCRILQWRMARTSFEVSSTVQVLRLAHYKKKILLSISEPRFGPGLSRNQLVVVPIEPSGRAENWACGRHSKNPWSIRAIM